MCGRNLTDHMVNTEADFSIRYWAFQKTLYIRKNPLATPFIHQVCVNQNQWKPKKKKKHISCNG